MKFTTLFFGAKVLQNKEALIHFKHPFRKHFRKKSELFQMNFKGFSSNIQTVYNVNGIAIW